MKPESRAGERLSIGLMAVGVCLLLGGISGDANGVVWAGVTSFCAGVTIFVIDWARRRRIIETGTQIDVR